MTVRIALSPESETKLRERAAAAGKQVEEFLRDEIEQRVLTEPPSAAQIAQGSGEWLARFRQWVQEHPARPFLADDSREAVYGDERD